MSVVFFFFTSQSAVPFNHFVNDILVPPETWQQPQCILVVVGLVTKKPFLPFSLDNNYTCTFLLHW